MSNKITKKRNKVIRDMKECFRSLYLPVINGQKKDSCDFMSNIDNNNLLAQITVEYRMEFEYANINFNLGAVPPEKIPDMLKMINLINGITPLYQYSVCPCCNEIIVHSQLSVPEINLPKDKFTGLLHDLLESTNISYPLIGMIVLKGGDPDKYFGIYKDAMQDIMHRGNGLNKEMQEKALKDLMSVFADLKITITDDDGTDSGFNIQYVHPGDQSLLFRSGTKLDSESRAIIIFAAPDFTIPDGKMAVMMELVNRINRLCGADHLFVDPRNKRNIFLTGIKLDNGTFRKEEFLNAFRMLIKDALSWFPIFKELLISAATPTDLMRTCMPCYNDKMTIH